METWLERGALTDVGGGRWGWYRTLSLALYPWRLGWVGKKLGDRKRESSSLAYGKSVLSSSLPVYGDHGEKGREDGGIQAGLYLAL